MKDDILPELIGYRSMDDGYPMTNWYCPQCGEENYDFCDQYTHCAYCGRVVWVMGEGQGAIDEKWNVPIEVVLSDAQSA